MLTITRTNESSELNQERLEGGQPLVVRLTSISEDGSAIGELLVDALRTPAGTKVSIASAPCVRLRMSLDACIRGNDQTPASRVGDVIAFASAYAKDGIAYVGEVSAREHEGHEGPVQILTAMARASRSKVSKRGPLQTLTVTDGDAAKVARSVDEVVKLLSETASRAWPGGDAGLIMRDEEGRSAEYFLGFDRDEDFLADELKRNKTFENGRLELIPAWRIPMGREQILREIDPRKETDWRSGPVTRMFEFGTSRINQGFLPCMLILGDEEEWAFKAKTGRTHRVVLGLQPILGRNPVSAARLPSAVRSFGGRSNGVKVLYDDVTLRKRAETRSPKATEPSPSKPPVRVARATETGLRSPGLPR